MLIGFQSRVESQISRALVQEVHIIMIILPQKTKSRNLLKCRISLESNISAKAKEKFQNYDLFENLAYDDTYSNEMRDEGSFRPKPRNTSEEKKNMQISAIFRIEA